MIVAGIEGLVLVLFFAIVFIDRLAASYSNSTLSSPQSSSTFSSPSNQSDTYKTEKEGMFHNSKGDIAD
jgi:hypothetical protein